MDLPRLLERGGRFEGFLLNVCNIFVSWENPSLDDALFFVYIDILMINDSSLYNLLMWTLVMIVGITVIPWTIHGSTAWIHRLIKVYDGILERKCSSSSVEVDCLVSLRPLPTHASLFRVSRKHNTASLFLGAHCTFEIMEIQAT
jgi:hypothetical protein